MLCVDEIEGVFCVIEDDDIFVVEYVFGLFLFDEVVVVEVCFKVDGFLLLCVVWWCD